ncbi:MAG: hypothetical protein K0S47_33 [Herbinix sp.]|jgi:hypothetical protein|nr:hypothetical protein [Herbinix sp.]
MTIKLVIADIKWYCIVPGLLFNDALLCFANDFSGKEDIKLEIRYTDYFDTPTGVSITNDILEWYIQNNEIYKYHLLKRDDSDTIFISLKTNESWSDVLIEVRQDYPYAIDMINILLTEIVFRNRLLFHDGLVIHSSAIEFEGNAIVFTAPSGTGKTTHARLWQEKYKVPVINDDHPAVRIIDEKPILYGTPWAGETKKFIDKSCILKGVVILEQGAQNQIWKADKNEIVKEFLPRCFLPYYDKNLMHKSFRIFSDIISNIEVYKLKCKPDQESVQLVQSHLCSNK